MSWDKIKVSQPVNRGQGADGESATVRPPDNPGSGDNPAEGLLNPGEGRRAARGHRPDAHPRVQDVLNEGKQKLEKLFSRAEGAPGERTRGAGGGDEHVPPGQAKKNNGDGGQTEGQDTGPRRAPSADDGDRRMRGDSLTNDDGRQRNVGGEHPRDTRHAGRGDSELLRDARGAGRGDDNGPGDNFFRTQSHNSGRDRGINDNSHGRSDGAHGRTDNAHGRGLLDGPGVGRRDGGGGVDVASLVSYLRGESGGGNNLPAELRRALDGASRVLGPDFLRSLDARGASGEGERVVKFVEHALERVARTLERAAERGGAAASGVPQRVLGEAVGELLAASLLDKYFRQAEKTGGRVVAQAEAALARMLYGDPRGGEGGGRLGAPGGFELPGQRRPDLPAPHPLEVLRDLNAGAFRPAEVGRSPFPLTGRALVATEMMEMMRTLDAVDRVTRELLAAARTGAATAATAPFAAGDADDTPALALLRALAGTAAGAELLDELLGALPPALPGRAARQEIPRLVAALGGVLADADGRTFVGKDGAPLKLDQMLWHGALGGVLQSSAAAESFPVRLSPLLIYGFDAVYSLIGFDGRTLNPPHFAAVQAQVNGSELEWVFGQPPLSEGWMRALIERLKDSAQPDNNLLGEMLEEALADGRFHAALVGGTVSEGGAQPDTFAVTRLLPAATAAFSPA